MDDLIRRQWLMECVNEGWIKFDTEKDKNIFIHLVRDIAPSAQTEPKSEFVKLIVRNSNGRPYYSIVYLEIDDNGIGHDLEGYSSYDLDVISDYLRRYFISPLSAQPEQGGEVAFWKERAREYEDIISGLVAEQAKGVKLDSIEITEGGIRFKKSQSWPRWIPVTKKSPDAYGWYLCSLKDGRTMRLYFDKRKSQWIDNAKKHMFALYDIIGKFSRVPITEEQADVYWDGWVTAWMPLPESYRGGEDE